MSDGTMRVIINGVAAQLGIDPAILYAEYCAIDDVLTIIQTKSRGTAKISGREAATAMFPAMLYAKLAAEIQKSGKA
jgi:hypothetical protein